MAKANPNPAPAALSMDGMRPLKKLTVRDIVGGDGIDIRDVIAFEETNPGQTLWLADVIGVVTGARPGTVNDQPYVRFLGSFRGTNLRTGQVFRSGAAILPAGIPDLLFGALQMGNAVQFGFRIGVKFDKTSATKYVYDAISLTKEPSTDPLAQLSAAIANGTDLPPAPQLSGPVVHAPEIARPRAALTDKSGE